MPAVEADPLVRSERAEDGVRGALRLRLQAPKTPADTVEPLGQRGGRGRDQFGLGLPWELEPGRHRPVQEPAFEQETDEESDWRRRPVVEAVDALVHDA